MANIKLGDLCKEIDASYKEMMSYLRERGYDVKSAGSMIDDEEQEVQIAITLYGKHKRKPAEKKEPAAKSHARFDDKGNRVVKKDGIVYSIDKGGNYTAYNGPLYDENHKKIEKRSLFDADKNPILRKGNEFYKKNENGDLEVYEGPIFNEEGRRLKRPTKDEAEAGKARKEAEKPVEKAENASANTEKQAASVKDNKPADSEQGQNSDVTEKTTEQPEKSVAKEEGKSAVSETKKDSEKETGSDNKKSDENKPSRREGQPSENGERRSDNQRPYKRDNQDGQNSQRPYNRDGQGGQRPYNRDGQRSYNRDGQDGQRPYNRDGQNGQRPYNRDGQGNQRPYNRDGQDGQRPYNRDGQGGQRPYNRDGQGGQRPYNRDGQNGQGGFRKPNGQGGFNRNGAQGGFDKSGFDKDKDSDQRRTFARKNDGKSSQNNSIKADFGNEINREQRAAAYNNKDRDRNRNNRDYENEDSLKGGKKSQQNKKDANRKGAFIMPKIEPKMEEDPNEIKNITIPEVITIKELADKMKQNSSAIIKKLFLSGKLYNINSEISFEEAEEIALEYNCIVEKEKVIDMVEELTKDVEDPEESLVKRPPVVCVMGHVDHGKTSILDAIRSAHVASREAGGITQHIGAYMVEKNGEKITFLDTPGHEAFTAMRLRGAMATDIAVLVVAADDGVMPQTIEAINHAKAAGVSIVVAINKMDKEGANPDRVLSELSEQGLVSEEWGGDIVTCRVSAKSGDGIEQLLEMILLSAEVLELKSNPNRKARGLVIEAKLDKGRGPVATVLVQKGTLHVGENVAIGSSYGKIRAMINDKGEKISEATPSTPVEILGLNSVPNAGDIVIATENEKEAKNISEAYIAQSKEKLIAETKQKLSLEGLYDQMKTGEMKDLNIIVKADVAGSVEAVKQSLTKLSNDEIAVHCIHGGVGNINESDVILASASNAIIIGFNVKPDNTAKDTAVREKVDIRQYSVIYNAIDDIEAAMQGMLDPIYEEVVIGHAEIRQIFKASGVGNIAGCYILDGKAMRNCKVRISRGEEKIFEGDLESLKRMKDDAKEVNAGFECGMVFHDFNDIAEGDQIELYNVQQVARKK